MQKHRIFIAINLPDNVKEKLVEYQNRIKKEDFGWAKWTKKDNLHITLEFLGSVWDKDMPVILEKANSVALKISPFNVKLNKIDYFPNEKNPKYVFATGGEYHITLARIKEWQWKRIDLDERPIIAEDINLEFKVNTIELMESKLKKSGPEYSIIQSYNLKDKH